MGFFSKLKKAWQSPEDVAQQALDEYKKEQGLEIEAKSAPAPAAQEEPALEATPSTQKSKPTLRPLPPRIGRQDLPYLYDKPNQSSRNGSISSSKT